MISDTISSLQLLRETGGRVGSCLQGSGGECPMTTPNRPSSRCFSPCATFAHVAGASLIQLLSDCGRSFLTWGRDSSSKRAAGPTGLGRASTANRSGVNVKVGRAADVAAAEFDEYSLDSILPRVGGWVFLAVVVVHPPNSDRLVHSALVFFKGWTTNQTRC
jgi:hypothetical protein